jgi:hypothetical protein
MKNYSFLLLVAFLAISCGMGTSAKSGYEKTDRPVYAINRYYAPLKYKLEQASMYSFCKKQFAPLRIQLDNLTVLPVYSDSTDMDTIVLDADYHDLLTHEHLLDSMQLIHFFQKYYSPESYYTFNDEEVSYYLYGIHKGEKFNEVFILSHENICGHYDGVIYLRINKAGETIYCVNHICCAHDSPYSSGGSYAVFDRDRNLIVSEKNHQYTLLQTHGKASFYNIDSLVLSMEFNEGSLFKTDTLFYKKWYKERVY